MDASRQDREVVVLVVDSAKPGRIREFTLGELLPEALLSVPKGKW